MQSQVVDNKLSKMGQLYGDQEFAANATKEVEAIRKRANQLGAFFSITAFGLNEVARMTLRTRKLILSFLMCVYAAMFKLRA